MKEAFSAVQNAFQIPFDLSACQTSLYTPISPLFPTNPGFPEDSPIFYSGVPFSVIVGDPLIQGLTPADITVCLTICSIFQQFGNCFAEKNCSEFSDQEKQIARFVIASLANELGKFSSIIGEEVLMSYIQILNQYADLIITPDQDEIVKQLKVQIDQICENLVQFFNSASNKRVLPVSTQYPTMSDIVSKYTLLFHTFGFFETLTGSLTVYTALDIALFNQVLQLIISPTDETISLINQMKEQLKQYQTTSLAGTSFAQIRENLINNILSTCDEILILLGVQTDSQTQVQPEPIPAPEPQQPVEPVEPPPKPDYTTRFMIPPETDFPATIEDSQAILTIIQNATQTSIESQSDFVKQFANSIITRIQKPLLSYACQYAVNNTNTAFCDLIFISALLPLSIQAGLQHYCAFDPTVFAQFFTQNTNITSLTTFVQYLLTNTDLEKEIEYNQLVTGWIINIVSAIRSFAASLIAAAAPVFTEQNVDQAEVDFKYLISFDTHCLNLSDYFEIIQKSQNTVKLLNELTITDFYESANQLQGITQPLIEFSQANNQKPTIQETTLEKHLEMCAKNLTNLLTKLETDANELPELRVTLFAFTLELFAAKQLIQNANLDQIITDCNKLITMKEPNQSINELSNTIKQDLKQFIKEPPKPTIQIPVINVPRVTIQTPVMAVPQVTNPVQSQTAPQQQPIPQPAPVLNTPPPQPEQAPKSAPVPEQVTPPPPSAPPAPNLPPPSATVTTKEPPAQQAPQATQTKQIDNSGLTLRSVRQVEFSRSLCSALADLAAPGSGESQFAAFMNSSNELQNALSGVKDTFTQQILQQIQKTQEEVEKIFRSGSRNYEQQQHILSRITGDIVNEWLKEYGLANNAQAEIILMNAKVDALQSQITAIQEEENSTPLRQLIAKEAKVLLKLTRSLGKAAREQAEYLARIKGSLSNEGRLIKSAQQTTDAAQMFFLLLKSTTPDDPDFKFKAVAGSRGMNAALTGLIMNFRALGGSPEISQRMETTVSTIAKRMQAIIERAEQDFGPDHDESLVQQKQQMTAHNLKVAKMNASNEVIKKRRELEEAEEALKRYNRAAAKRTRSQKM